MIASEDDALREHFALTLSGGEGTDHDETSTHTGEETGGAELAGHLDETRGDRLAGSALGLVDLGEEGVGGLGDDGGGHTGDETTTEVEGGGLSAGELALGLTPDLEDLLHSDLVHGELGHGVRDLLEQDGAETGRGVSKDAAHTQIHFIICREA
jgi:hypothetical protein